MWVLDDGNSYNTQAAEIRVMYDEATPGTSKGGSRMEIRTTASGAATPTTRITIYSTGGLVIGAATGGDKGTGTINAVGVYDDNTLLTCFGIEYLKYGSVDLVKWDGYAPGGKHKLAHAFINMINNNFDPRNHRSYIVKMMEDEALPGMPSQKTWKHNTLTVGEMTDRLWLAAEFQAGAIHSIAKELDGLGSRLARLER
jgi:hypothetical protein